MTAVADPRFRAALVDLLTHTGTSQARLADLSNVSRSYICQLIAGDRSPSPRVAEALDAALGAGGSLAALVNAPSEDRIQVDAAVANPRRAGLASVAGLARILDGQRTLDDTLGSANVIAPATTQVAAVAAMVREVTGPTRPLLMSVAAQWAEFVGWLHTSVAHWDGARTWFATGAEWAAEVGDPDLSATLVSYQAHVAWLTGQWAPAVGLAEAAAADLRVYPGQRAYDTFAAARGHALYGDLNQAERMIGDADRLAEDAATCDDIPAWQYYRGAWQWSAERGLVRLHMAHHDPRHAVAAVADLEVGVAGIPVDMAGADWAAEYMTHLAGAYLLADQPDQARVVLDQAAAIARQTGSQRVLRQVTARERRLRAMRR